MMIQLLMRRSTLSDETIFRLNLTESVLDGIIFGTVDEVLRDSFNIFHEQISPLSLLNSFKNLVYPNFR